MNLETFQSSSTAASNLLALAVVRYLSILLDVLVVHHPVQQTWLNEVRDWLLLLHD